MIAHRSSRKSVNPNAAMASRATTLLACSVSASTSLRCSSVTTSSPFAEKNWVTNSSKNA